MLLLPITLFAQQNDPAVTEQDAPSKFALVIGNSNYSGLTPLANPVNDANDIAVVLEYLGFTVDKVINGTLDQMDDALIRLKDRLGESGNSYGFFFYAGHGVQSGGENFLIPVDANIPSENYLRSRAVSVQALLDDLNDARNGLNVIVLDACRDNPFGWSRSGTRGLSIVTRQPADSIIVYATSAGQRASDGDGRNGVFTKELLNNLLTPGLEVAEVFRRTGLDVSEASGGQQIPAIYNQFFKTAYLGVKPDDAGLATMPMRPLPFLPGMGEDENPKEKAAKLWSVGATVGTSFADPWVIGTLHGTIAPFRYTFLELGVDIGFISTVKDMSYYSFYPFAHIAFFWPAGKNVGWYAGAGGGYQIARYKIDNLGIARDIFAADFTTGLLLFNFLNLSYTIRTNFSSASNKLAAGYSYRF